MTNNAHEHIDRTIELLERLISQKQEARKALAKGQDGRKAKRKAKG